MFSESINTLFRNQREFQLFLERIVEPIKMNIQDGIPKSSSSNVILFDVIYFNLIFYSLLL